jgi:uncharacterized protein YndB with AHSA1/START domain
MPVITRPPVVLRAFRDEDAGFVQSVAGDPLIPCQGRQGLPAIINLRAGDELPGRAESNWVPRTRTGGIVNSDQQPAEGRRGGHALSVERIIDAPPEVIFDAFIAMYDSQRPDWVTDSQLDLRPGGRWSVGFRVPNGPAFREERVITAVERPRRLTYDTATVYRDAPGFNTAVEVTIEAVPYGHRVRLAQQGFPTIEARNDFAGAWPDVLDELSRRASLTGQT